MYHDNHRLRLILPALMIAMLSAMVTACGFQLRGVRPLLPELSVTYIRAEDPNGALVSALRRQLTASGARVTRRQEEATAVLEILQDHADRRVLSVGSTGKAREYELHHKLVFRLLDAAGKEILSRQELSLTREFVFDETDVLGKANEEGLVRNEIQQDLVRLILLQLESAPAKTGM